MWHLFDVVGIELEYMIVDSGSMMVRPVCDRLLQGMGGTPCNDWANGPIAWSNELVMHVVELKTNGPARSWDGLADRFHHNVLLADGWLSKMGCGLLPTACHPWMDPDTETCIWPYEFHEIYELYDRIFGCKGHGWSNLQSMHINLPFAGDGEFARLHTAIRLLMPVMPALFASSPILEGRPTGFADSRMEAYRHNQEKIPSIAGMVVPEMVTGRLEYDQKIFAPIVRDIKPYDAHGVLDKHFLNSRGCIARFDRGAIEIRVLDLQESPKADLALARFLVETVKQLVGERWTTFTGQKNVPTELLHAQLLSCIKNGSDALPELEYLKIFGVTQSMSAQDFWRFLFDGVQMQLPRETVQTVRSVIDMGCLSARIMKAVGANPDTRTIKTVYRRLADCLVQNTIFRP
ncbi:MAG: glutamate-cysteine ligase family protein [Breznakibacter sp.]